MTSFSTLKATKYIPPPSAFGKLGKGTSVFTETWGGRRVPDCSVTVLFNSTSLRRPHGLPLIQEPLLFTCANRLTNATLPVKHQTWKGGPGSTSSNLSMSLLRSLPAGHLQLPAPDPNCPERG